MNHHWNGLDTLEPRLMLSAAFTSVDDDGDRYTVKLTGPGEMAVIREDSNPDNLGSIRAIELWNTDESTRLSVKVRKGSEGDGVVKIGTIRTVVLGDGSEETGTKSLKSIHAPRADLIGGESEDPDTGGIFLGGSLGKLKIRDIFDAAVQTGPASDENPAKTKIFARNIGAGSVLIIGTEDPEAEQTSFDPLTTLVMLKAAQIGPAIIATQNAQNIRVVGNEKAELPGDFSAELGVGELGNLFVANAMIGANVHALRVIRDINTGALISSNIFAGFDEDPNTVTIGGPQMNEIPDSSDDFVNKFTAEIRKVKVRGLPGEGFSVVNSNIAAWKIGRITLTDIDTDNGDVPFGVAGNKLKVLVIRDSDGNTRVFDVERTGQTYNDGDFETRLF